MKRLKMKIIKSQAGQAIVEFAIIVPLLLTLLLGMLEWGFTLWTQTTYVNAVREGARSAVVIRDWSVNTETKRTDVKNVVVNRVSALPASITNGITTHITVELLPGVTNVSSIRVSIVNHPYVPVIGFAAFLVPGTLSATAEFRYEGSL